MGLGSCKDKLVKLNPICLDFKECNLSFLLSCRKKVASFSENWIITIFNFQDFGFSCGFWKLLVIT